MASAVGDRERPITLHPKTRRLLRALSPEERAVVAADHTGLRLLASLPPSAQVEVAECIVREVVVDDLDGGRVRRLTIGEATEFAGVDPAEIRSRPNKSRKPNEATRNLHAAIAQVAALYDRMTVRQLYYQLVSHGLPKTEAEYRRVCDAAGQMRLAGTLPYRKIADGSRSRRAVYQHRGMGEALANAAALYRKNYWIDQPTSVEIWCEKDALTGVIQPICEEYGVPYVATRGFPSLTLLYESALAMRETGKPTVVYYFGDHDASGHAISARLEETLLGHGADVEVRRVALWPEQVQQYRLPTRPGKSTDSRHAGFVREYGDAAVELDALPPSALESLVRRSVEENIDWYSWARMRQQEGLERETLDTVVAVGQALTPGMRLELPEGSA